MGRYIFLLMALALVGQPQESEAKGKANFSLIKSGSEHYVLYKLRKYKVLRVKGASEKGAIGIAGDMLGTLARGVGLTNGLNGQRVAIECVLWPQPDPFSSTVKKQCQVPGKIAEIGFNYAEFTESQWRSLKADLKSRYSADETIMGNHRSVLLVGTVKTTGWGFFSGPRQSYLTVDAWSVIGNVNDYTTVAADIASIIQFGGQLGTGAAKLSN